MVKRKRKSESTPEEWAAYLAEARKYWADNKERLHALRREYSAKPEVRAARIARESTPEGLAKRRAKDARGHKKNWQKIIADPEKHAAHKAGLRKWRTGFSQSDIDALITVQGGKCAVCDEPIQGRQIRADHCHDTNTPRGLLCHHCNIVEGLLKRKNMTPKEYGEKLQNYLEHPPCLML
jgi:hypothetical protein